MLLLTSLLFGCLVSGLTWNLYRVFSQVPSQDRSLLDRPPLGFTIVWPLINSYCFYFGRWTSQNFCISADLRLKKAGMQYALSPQQFFAAKAVSCLITLLAGLWVLHLLAPSLATFAVLLAYGGFMYPDLWLRESTKKRQKKILRTLPNYLDIVILSIEAGTNLTGGITHAVQKSPESPLRAEFSRVLRDIRSGKKRAVSLREMTERVGVQPLTNVVNSMIQSEQSGSSLGKVLRAQADQLRSGRFLQAEKLAMEAPVKLLAPLVMFIFPTTFLVLAYVILSKAIQSNIIKWGPLVWAYTWPG